MSAPRLAFLLALLSGLPTSAGEAAKRDFIVATWNLEWFYDHDSSDNRSDLAKKMSAPSKAEWDWRLEHTAAAIASMKPTILALQEIENAKVVRELAQVLRARHNLDYLTGFIQGTDTETEQDVAVLHQLPGATFKRGPGSVVFKTDPNLYRIPSRHVWMEVTWSEAGKKRKLTLVNVHLKAGDNSEPQRAQQARVLHHWLAPLVQKGENVIVLGDFNASELYDKTTPGSGVGLTRGLHTKETTDDLEDLHKFLTPVERKSHLSKKELDRVLVSPALFGKAGLKFESIVNRRDLVIRGQPDKQRYLGMFRIPQAECDLSDHYPLVVRFSRVP